MSLAPIPSPDYLNLGEYIAHGVAPLPGLFSTFRMPFIGTLYVLLVEHWGFSPEAPCLAARFLTTMLVAALGALVCGRRRAIILIPLAYWWFRESGLIGFENNVLAVWPLSVASLVIWRSRAPSWYKDVFLGLVFGAAFLTRSSLALFAPCLVCFEWIQRRSRPKIERLKSASLLLIIPMVMLLPWMRLNWNVYREIVPFERGAADSNIVSGAAGLVESMEGNYALLMDGGAGGDAPRSALRWAATRVTAHPVLYLKAVLRRIAKAVSWQPLLFLLAAGGIVLGRRRRERDILALLTAYWIFIHCLMAVEERYFIPIVPLLGVLAASIAAAVMDRMGGEGRAPWDLPEGAANSLTRTAPAAVAIFAAPVLSFTAYLLIGLTRLSVAAKADPVQARESLSRAMETHPRDHWLLFARGKQRLSQDDYAGAADDFEASHRLRPQFAELALYAAWARWQAGDAGPLKRWRLDGNEGSMRIDPGQGGIAFKGHVFMAHARGVAGDAVAAKMHWKQAQRSSASESFVRGDKSIFESELESRLKSAQGQFLDMTSRLLRGRPLQERILSYKALEGVLPGFRAENVLLSQEARPARELQDAGSYDRALAAFNRLIESHPHSAALYSDRGVFFYLQGRPGDAMRDWKRAIALDGCYWPALTSFGSMAAASPGNMLELRGYCARARACVSKTDDDEARVLFAAACARLLGP